MSWVGAVFAGRVVRVWDVRVGLFWSEVVGGHGDRGWEGRFRTIDPVVGPVSAKFRA